MNRKNADCPRRRGERININRGCWLNKCIRYRAKLFSGLVYGRRRKGEMTRRDENILRHKGMDAGVGYDCMAIIVDENV